MKKEYVCHWCKYFPQCGDKERKEPCRGYDFDDEGYHAFIEKEKKETKNFFADLVGSCKGTKYRWEIFTDEMVELMHISLEEAQEWERKLIKYGVTERQNGGIVTNA